MADDLSSLINTVKNMVDNDTIPDNVKEILENLNSSNSTNSENFSFNNVQNSNNNPNNNNTDINLDMNTILKMKSLIDTMNKKDDPRSNLLHSLKPYLRESRKDKLDQYVNLLNVTKVADIMKNENKEDNKNA